MKIVWTRRAYLSWLDAAQYINKEFGLKALNKFNDKTKEWEKILLSMPTIGHIEPLLKGMSIMYRSIVISKQNKLIYFIESDNIIIADFWDTRREPKKLAQNL